MPKVVLADADAERRGSDRFVLASSGAAVVEVDSLRAALAAVATEGPDAVVLSAELLDTISPARFVGVLRAQPETQGVRVVLVVAGERPTDLEGVAAVLSRPTWPLDLVSATFV